MSVQLRPGYKQTEVGVIPEDWIIGNLGMICDVRDGTHESPRFLKQGIPFVTSKNIVDGRLDLENVNYISKADAIEFDKRSKVEINDILMSMIGTIGSAVLVNSEPNFCIKNVALIKPRRVFPPYLVQLINSPFFQRYLGDNLDGGIQKFIALGTLRQLAIPEPLANEQEAIAEALSDADALIESLEQLLAKKRHLKQGTMQELLTGKKRLPGFSDEWEVKRLGELGSTYGGLTGKTKADFGHGNGRYITFMNVMSNVTINCEIFEEVDVAVTESQNLVALGDLLFNGSSETPEEVAMCSLLTEDVSRLFLNSFCFGFRLHNQLDADGLFLTYYIRSLEGRELMKSLAQGSTRYNLSKGALLDAKITLAKKSEQTAIAAILSDMDAEIAELETQLTKTRTLKQGMMHKLLTGEIRLI